MVDRGYRPAVLSAASLLLSVVVSQAAPLTSAEVQSLHANRIESLRRLTGVHDEFRYSVHTLIVPLGAVANYQFPIPVARIRYEAVPLFAFDDAQLRNDAKGIVEDLAKRFAADKNLQRIAVVGHTDSIGLDAYNSDLSLRRALSVANLLRVAGVPAARITVHGLGEAYPIATNASDDGRALNRRVEFFLSSVPEAIPPGIKGRGFDPKFRNNHEPSCNKPGEESPECGKTTVNKFQTHQLTPDGKLRPIPEVITIDPKPEFPVVEIPERDHVPVSVKTRPHI
jgi:hypothetical protein